MLSFLAAFASATTNQPLMDALGGTQNGVRKDQIWAAPMPIIPYTPYAKPVFALTLGKIMEISQVLALKTCLNFVRHCQTIHNLLFCLNISVRQLRTFS